MPSSANSQQPSPIAGPSAASSDDMSSPCWQSLHADLLQLISWRVLAGDLLDYIRFRAVCTQWRSSNVSPLGRGVVDPRFHPRRWMLLPEGHGLHPGDGNKTFFNLSTGVSVHARLMLSSGCCILDSAEGLLLVQWGTQDHDKVRLLHPFTGDFVELPPLMSLTRMHLNMTDGTRRRRRPECVDFRSATSITVTEGGLITAMIMINHVSSVFFATTKDRQWSVSTWSIAPYSSSIAFQGKFYMLVSPTIHGSEQQILRLDPPGHEHEAMSSSSLLLLLPPKLIGTCPTDKIRGQFTIAECDSEILLISFDDGKKKSKSRMLVYRVSDLAKGEVVPVTSIGSNILFLDSIGNGSSSIRDDDDDDIFVHVRKNMVVSYNAIPAIEGNTVVRRGRLKDNNPWRYDLGSGKRSLTPTSRCKDGRRSCSCGLVYHIYDCCHCAKLHVSK